MSDNEAKPDGDSKPADGAEPITIRVRDQVRMSCRGLRLLRLLLRLLAATRGRGAGLERCQQVGDDVFCELGDVATCEVSWNIFSIYSENGCGKKLRNSSMPGIDPRTMRFISIRNVLCVIRVDHLFAYLAQIGLESIRLPSHCRRAALFTY